MSISVRNITKRFGSFVALDDVSLEIETGSLTALLGPSGSGKTTLLRVIAGLETADSGLVFFDGKETTALPVRERNVGFVFQHYALFRHMTVRENIAFGLTVRKRSKDECAERVAALLQLIQMEGLADRYPSELSGGQRQRVALARALAIEPRVLLLDEPFGALDARVRKELRDWLRDLHEHVQVTSLFVTHDQEEAMEVADQIVVFNQGRIEQVGSPQDIYEQPATPFVMRFIGTVNVLPADSPLLRQSAVPSSPPQAEAFVRPHNVQIVSQPTADTVAAQVQRLIHLGWDVELLVRLPDNHELTVRLTREELFVLERKRSLKAGETVHLRPRDVRIFSGAGT